MFEARRTRRIAHAREFCVFGYKRITPGNFHLRCAVAREVFNDLNLYSGFLSSPSTPRVKDQGHVLLGD